MPFLSNIFGRSQPREIGTLPGAAVSAPTRRDQTLAGDLRKLDEWLKATNGLQGNEADLRDLAHKRIAGVFAARDDTRNCAAVYWGRGLPPLPEFDGIKVYIVVDAPGTETEITNGFTAERVRLFARLNDTQSQLASARKILQPGDEGTLVTHCAQVKANGVATPLNGRLEAYLSAQAAHADASQALQMLDTQWHDYDVLRVKLP